MKNRPVSLLMSPFHRFAEGGGKIIVRRIIDVSACEKHNIHPIKGISRIAKKSSHSTLCPIAPDCIAVSFSSNKSSTSITAVLLSIA